MSIQPILHLLLVFVDDGHKLFSILVSLISFLRGFQGVLNGEHVFAKWLSVVGKILIHDPEYGLYFDVVKSFHPNPGCEGISLDQGIHFDQVQVDWFY